MVDVVVVGLGPVGSLLALLLAEAGQKVLVLERSTEPVVLPRAVALDGEAMRTFQQLGLAEKVSAILQPARNPDEVCFANSKREKLFGSRLPDCGPNGWRDLAFFDQPELEALLRAEVAKSERIEVRLGCEVTGLENADEAVMLECRSTRNNASLTIEARYVLGCDGASSFIRSAAGIGWKSLGYDQDWLVVDIVIQPEAELPMSTMQVCDPNRLATYVCVKDPNRRWEFQMLPGETRAEMQQPQRIQELLDPWLPPEHYTIRRAAVYQFHAATAETWRRGRILLVGDAAHQTPPFLGQGLNTGIRDAANLAWKLTRVLRGECTDQLLDSYEEERDPQARELVSGAVAVGQLMEVLAAREAGRPDPPLPASGPPEPGRLVPPLRSGLLVADQLGQADTSVGTLIRQPDVREAAGGIGPLDDLLGSGFAILGQTGQDLRLSPESQALWKALGGRLVALEDFEYDPPDQDPLFEHHPAALIRPDRYVYGVVDAAWTLERLIGHLATEMGYVE